jgi:hypothetical protein
VGKRIRASEYIILPETGEIVKRNAADASEGEWYSNNQTMPWYKIYKCKHRFKDKREMLEDDSYNIRRVTLRKSEGVRGVQEVVRWSDRL